MRITSQRELRNDNAAIVRGVEAGESYTITRRGVPVAPGGNLRSLDAFHLAAAVRIGVEHLVTYDVRMSDSARALGLSVITPA